MYPTHGNERQSLSTEIEELSIGFWDLVRNVLSRLSEAEAEIKRLTIERDLLQSLLNQPQPTRIESKDNRRDREKQEIIRALSISNGIQKDAAKILGISPRIIHYRMKRYGLISRLSREPKHLDG